MSKVEPKQSNKTSAKTRKTTMNTTQQPVAIVTGASGGIGLGITQALLERGWRAVATSRTISESKNFKPSSDLVLVDGEVSKKETAPSRWWTRP